jgi:hypothetical protein
MVICRYGEVLSHFNVSSMAAHSVPKAVCLVPSVLAPWAMAGPAAISSAVMIHPTPADLRNEPFVRAWHASMSGMSELRPTNHVGRHGRAEAWSMFPPSLIRHPWWEAAENHPEMRCRLESSSGCRDSSAFLLVPAGAAMAEISSHSLLLSSEHGFCRRCVCCPESIFPFGRADGVNNGPSYRYRKPVKII